MSINALVEDMNSSGVHDNFLSVGRHLSETKWRDLCEDVSTPIENDTTRYGLAVMLENTERYIQNLDETTRAVAVGDFQKYAMPLVRAIYPELIANELVSVQPMLGPVSLVFYMDMVYGSNKGNVRRGDTAFSSVARGANNPDYSSPTVDSEQVGVGTGAPGGAGTPTLSYLPLVPGTIQFTDGTQIITDDGNGNLTGDILAGAANARTIDYESGTVSGALNFKAAVAAGVAVTCTYQYNTEANSNIPQMDLVLNHSPISARPRKLRTNWSLEAAFNLRSLHGLEAEVELTAAVAADIRFEVDREIITDLQRMSGAGSVYWNTHPGGSNATGNYYSYTEHKLSIVDAFVTGSNLIHKATGRGRANWIVCGEKVATVVETLPGFVANPGVPTGLTKGAYRCGRLNGMWDIYKDPFYQDEYFLMGYKGASFLEAGYVYAPYIPLYTTPTVVLDDFVARKGLATQYGKKAINSLFYVTGQIGNLAALAAKAGKPAAAFQNDNFGSATDINGIADGRGVFGS
jgi:hypothetical protein